MRKTPIITLKAFVGAAVIAVAINCATVRAGNFDCSVIYDEFDQLMTANFLVNPEDYVETINKGLLREEYVLYQFEKFKVRQDRALAGIAVVRTNENLRGKMTFIWHDLASEQTIPFIIDELIVYGRASDGYAPVRSTSIYLTPGYAVDFDSATIVDIEDERADLRYDFIDDIYSVQAIEPAELYFPTESMCQQTAGETQ